MLAGLVVLTSEETVRSRHLGFARCDRVADLRRANLASDTSVQGRPRTSRLRLSPKPISTKWRHPRKAILL